MMSKAIDYSRSGKIHFYHGAKHSFDWSTVSRQLAGVLYGGERIKLHKPGKKKIPEGAFQMNNWFDKNQGEDHLPKHFSNGVPYAKINWDKVRPEWNRLGDLDLNYDKTICWFRRPQSHQPSRPRYVRPIGSEQDKELPRIPTFKYLAEVPRCLKEKYSDFNFLNLGEPFGGWDKNFQGSLSPKGSGPVYDFHTILFIMKKCHKILNTDSGGMHLALTAVDIDKLLYYEDSKNFDTWQANMYYKMGVTFLNELGTERVCPEDERCYLR
tara:strand:- start:13157 stop:13960 length:804 start_codon:yes stop_codon:yes gene_type:complete